MYDFETLPDALAAAARTQAGVTFTQGKDSERVSYAELHAAALACLGRLQAHGLEPGCELIVHVPDNRAFLEAFWACLLGGIVPVPLALGISDEHRLKLLRVYRRLARPALFTDAGTLARLESFSAGGEADEVFAQMKSGAVIVDAEAATSFPGVAAAVRPSDLAFVQFSSGSTSEPKGVQLTHANVLTNIRAIIAGAELGARDKTLSWMPLSHDMGMIGFHLTPMVLGVDQVLIPTETFVRRPAIWLRATTESRATLLCSPNFGYKHFLKSLDRRDPGPLDLSSVRVIFNGAEPVSIGLCSEFLDRMATHGLRAETMFPVYGLAEASVAVSFPKVGTGASAFHVRRSSLGVGERVERANPGEADSVPFAKLGRAVPDCELRIVGDDGSPLGDRTVGHVEIRGGNVTQGYYRDDEATRAVMRGDGWLDTGDLGFLAEGELVITGRHKDIIFSNGQNFFPHDLEGILERATGLELGKIAVAGHRFPDAEADDVLVFIVHKGDLEQFVALAGDVTAILNAQMGIDVTHVVPVTRLPKTTSGKVQRAHLARSYAEGEFAAELEALGELRGTRPSPADAKGSQGPAATAATAAESGPAGASVGPPAEDASAEPASVADTLLGLCRSILPGREVAPDDNLFEIGTSSVELAQIHEGIERAFPGIVDITDLFDYPTVNELAGFLEGKLPDG